MFKFGPIFKNLIFALLIPGIGTGLSFPNPANGQSVLDQYLEEGVKANLRLINEQMILRDREFDLANAKSQFLPTVTFDASYLLVAGGRTIDFPVGDLFNPVYGTLNELSGNSQFPTNLSNVNIQLAPNNFHDTQLKLIQPVFNTSIYYNQKAQERLIDVQQAKLDAYKEELKKEIKVAYFGYLKTLKVAEIYDTTEYLLQEILNLNRTLVKYDKATKDVIASVEFEIAQLQSDRATTFQQEQTAKALFNLLLNKPLNSSIEEMSIPEITRMEERNLEAFQRNGLQTRFEIQQVERGIVANQVLTELRTKERLPTVGIEAAAGFQGFGYKFNSDQAIASIGIGLNWTLFQGKLKRNQIEQSKLRTLTLNNELDQLKQQIELQILQHWYIYEAALKKYEAETSAMQSAFESFAIIRKKYENNQAILIEYLDAKTKYTNAKVAQSIAQFDCLIRKAELEWAAGL